MLLKIAIKYFKDYNKKKGGEFLGSDIILGMRNGYAIILQLLAALGATPVLAGLALVPYPRAVEVLGGISDRANVRYHADAGLQAEGYRLEITSNGIDIASSDEAGRFYARMTLDQLRRDDGRFPCVKVADRPAFRWRGVHFDDCRHFFGKESVKHTLDQMARHKFNVFHWHLTDDQGWRIDVPGYPELVKYAAVRKSSPVRGSVIKAILDPQEQDQDGCRYGPFFYTESDLREIVAYAAERHIMIVPEIEAPGHVMAALAAYPQFACNPENFARREPPCIWGGFEDSLCIGNDAAVTFIEDVFDYICRVFPGPYVHIGGDECSDKRWAACPKCQARVAAEGLGSAKGLHPWFTRRIVKFLAGRGRRAIGWEEYLKGDVPQNAVGMYWFCWKGTERVDYLTGGWEPLEKGHEMVMATAAYTYYNLGQGLDDPFQYGQSGRAYGGGKLTLEKAYAFDPLAGVDGKYHKQILGGQCCTWSECTWNQYDFDWKLWPRACALAEVLWTGDAKPGYADFRRRMEAHRQRLLGQGVNCATLSNSK